MPRKRNPLLAKVHIAAKELALHEDSYRALLRRITGHDSAAACSEAELEAVVVEFRRLGWADKRRVPRSHKAYVRMIYGVWNDLRPYLRDGSKAALRRFVQRQTRNEDRPDGVTDPEFLNPEDGNLVVEGLKAWLARERHKAAAGNGKAAAE
jgi:hypothetical protein